MRTMLQIVTNIDKYFDNIVTNTSTKLWEIVYRWGLCWWRQRCFGQLQLLLVEVKVCNLLSNKLSQRFPAASSISNSVKKWQGFKDATVQKCDKKSSSSQVKELFDIRELPLFIIYQVAAKPKWITCTTQGWRLRPQSQAFLQMVSRIKPQK